MSVVWLINDTAPASLGVSVASAHFPSRSIGRVVLQITNATLAESAGFTYRQAVTIKRDGATWFQGRVARRPRTAGGTVTTTIEIWDAWWDLMLLTYEQVWHNDLTSRVMLGAPAIVAVTDNGGVRVGTAAWVKYNATEGDRETTAEEITRLIGYAAQNGVSIQLGDVPTGFHIWPVEFNSRKVGELLMVLLMWHPFVVTWFDYSTTPPTLHIRARNDENEAKRPAVATLDASSAQISDLECGPREDLVPAAIVIRYEDVIGNLARLQYEDKWPAEATGREIGAVLMTITLPEGQSWDVEEVEGELAPPEDWPTATIPAGFAQRYVEQYTLTHDGSLMLAEDDVGATSYTGKVLNLSNGMEGWSTMRAPVQSVAMDLRRGRTSISFGSGEESGIEEALQRLLRSVPPMTQEGRDQPPVEEVEELVLPGPLGALSGYCALVDDEVVFRVASGSVSGGNIEEEEVIPKWESTSTQLDAEPPPGGVIAEGADLVYWLYIEATPNVAEFALLDDSGAPLSEWRGVGSMTIDEARIVFDNVTPAARKPIIDPEDGSVTQTLRAYIRLGHVVWTVGETSPVVNVERYGGLQLIFSAPASLLVVLG